MSTTVDFKHVDDLVETLRHAKINADVDPGKVKLPGVWVQVAAIALERLDGYTFRTTLALIVKDRDVRHVMGDLAELHNKVRALVPNHGEAVARTYLLPAHPSTPMPGLAVPFNLRIKGDTP